MEPQPISQIAWGSRAVDQKFNSRPGQKKVCSHLGLLVHAQLRRNLSIKLSIFLSFNMFLCTLEMVTCKSICNINYKYFYFFQSTVNDYIREPFKYTFSTLKYWCFNIHLSLCSISLELMVILWNEIFKSAALELKKNCLNGGWNVWAWPQNNISFAPLFVINIW